MLMGGGRIKCPPIKVGGPGIIVCRMGAITGPPGRAIVIGGPETRTGNLCIMAAWFIASACFACWTAACWAAETALASC